MRGGFGLINRWFEEMELDLELGGLYAVGSGLGLLLLLALSDPDFLEASLSFFLFFLSFFFFSLGMIFVLLSLNLFVSEAHKVRSPVRRFARFFCFVKLLPNQYLH